MMTVVGCGCFSCQWESWEKGPMGGSIFQPGMEFGVLDEILQQGNMNEPLNVGAFRLPRSSDHAIFPSLYQTPRL